jgi:hypothetical protein
MKRKAMIRLDIETLDPNVVNQIIANCNLTKIDEQIYSFEFDDVIFLHALFLLGNDPHRLGYDLGLYLNEVIYAIERLPNHEYIALDTCPSEGKKRMSENFGVGLSSLMMVNSFNIKWEHISQIDGGKGKRPDFIALKDPYVYIYESKGTTQANKIRTKMGEAIEQKNSYREQAERRLAFVSYFPTDSKIFPTFVFIADPPFDLTNFPKKWIVVMSHYLKALEYSHLNETLKNFKNLLYQKYRMKSFEEKPPYNIPHKDRIKLETLQKTVLEVFEEESKKLKTMEEKNIRFIGFEKEFKRKNSKMGIYFGVDYETIENILNLSYEDNKFEDSYTQDNNIARSIFSDGTILKIEMK